MFLLIAGCLGTRAQVQVESAIDTISILVGQQVHLSLSVTAPKDARLLMPRYKAQQMMTPGVEVLDDHQADTTEMDNNFVKVTPPLHAHLIRRAPLLSAAAHCQGERQGLQEPQFGTQGAYRRRGHSSP